MKTSTPRTVYPIQPLQDPRWPELVAKHPLSSAFHTVAWCDALRRTYGYQPVAYTTSPPGCSLENGLVFCRVESWITGRRLISLPFSDHCDPLLNGAADTDIFLSSLENTFRLEKLRYIELRPRQPLVDEDGTGALFDARRLGRAVEAAGSWRPADTFCFHQLDLRPDLPALFGHFNKSSTQRKVLRALREGLACEAGRSDALLDAFWHLLLITRRRHGVPPQPKRWFRNLVDCFGNDLQIRVAYKDKRPVASILTLRHKDTLVYKYGCSDTGFNNLGGTQLLFWMSIQEAKREGLRVFDLGRSDSGNTGLIKFKDRWGSARFTLTYLRFSLSPPPAPSQSRAAGWAKRIAQGLVVRLPDRLFCLAGSALYRHVA